MMFNTKQRLQELSVGAIVVRRSDYASKCYESHLKYGILNLPEQLIAAARGDMTKANRCYAYFYVAGSFHPAKITERVGISPTKSSLEGSAIEGTRIVQKCSRWMLYSRLEETETLERHVSDVLAQLDENRDAFKQLSTELGGVMELVGYFHVYYPGLTLERDVIARLAEYSLSMDCDFYYLSDEAADSRSPEAHEN